MKKFLVLSHIGVRSLHTVLFSLCSLSLAPSASQAQDYPNQPIRMIVPYPAGGPTDHLVRPVALKMGVGIGQNFIIDNKGGASGTIGSAEVARSKGDGYTILGNASLHVIAPLVQPNLRYDAIDNFEPITQLADVPLVLVVNSASPIKTVADLITLAKSQKGQLFFGSPGTASSQHLAGESFKLAADISLQHVPYKGSAPALTDLLGGQIQLMFDSMPSAMPFIKSGRLRAVAVTTAKRSSALPAVPTVAESGLPGFNISTWYGLWAPRGTTKAIVDRLAAEASAALQQPDIQKLYSEMGATPVASSPEAFKKFVAIESNRWAEVVRKAGVKVGD